MCGGCKSSIENERSLRCCICAQVYDLLCANVPIAVYSTMTTEHREKWVCLECKCKQPRGDNSNTPVRSTRSEAGSIYCDDQSMNVTIRKTQFSQNRKSTKQLYDEYLHPDETYLDNLRGVIQEEFKDAINERLANMISNVVAKQVDLIFTKGFLKLSDQIMRLEKQLNLMTSRSVCNSANCKQGAQKCHASNDVDDCKNKSFDSEKTTVVLSVTPVLAENTSENTGKPQTKSILNAIAVSEPSLGKDASKPPKRNKPAPLSKTLLTQEDQDTNRKMAALDTSAERVQNQNDQSVHSQGEWIQVAKKRHNKSPKDVIRGSATSGLTQLEAAERVRYMHLYYVKVDTTEEQVLDHLKSIVNSEEYTVECLKARGNYSSFKLGVPSRLENCVMSSEHWPENICIKPWRQNFRGKSAKPFQEQKPN